MIHDPASATNVYETHTRQWLGRVTASEEYMDPEYYLTILRPYVFDGLKDTEIFRAFLDRLAERPNSALEVGPGPGRATTCLLETFPGIRYTGIDLSHAMLAYCQKRFASYADMDWVRSDALEFASTAHGEWDLVFSLWSFSHAVHQSIARTGNEREAREAVLTWFQERIAPGGSFFLLHFDSTSEEQQISLRQRRRRWGFLVPGEESPSERIITACFEDLQSRGWSTSIAHLRGTPLQFTTLDDAVEYYMNLHMEGWFNEGPERDAVISSLESDLRRLANPDGVIQIAPGSVVFTATRPK